MTLLDYFCEDTQMGRMWDREKNADLKLEALSPGSRKYAWWRCSQGHSWRARVYSVKAGCACPYCSGRNAIPGETDLATTHPELLMYWSEKNTLQPTQVTAGSCRKVWWVCDKGHEWETLIPVVAVEGCGCPYCAGKRAIPGQTDMQTLRPDMMEQWDWEKNTGMDPWQILPASHEKAWWRCEKGHSWKAMIYARTRENGSGCPYCTGRQVLPGFNDLATLMPRVAGEWHPGLNGTLRPVDVTLGSNKKVWWQCSEGHVWQAVVYSRTRKKRAGCPICAGTVKQKPAVPVLRKANPRRVEQRPRV